MRGKEKTQNSHKIRVNERFVEGKKKKKKN